MSSEITLDVANISKRFEIYSKPSDRLWQTLSRGRKDYFKEFWALKDVSFNLKRGETLGILGLNGAGKSTLLQIICGTLTQTSGTIKTSSRISALLELGAGFNSEFTGRENVYLNCALHGMTKREIDQKFEEIASFADIGDFIEQPVKLYSSGMYARLAFSAAVHVDPELFIVDEALSVGDMAFQEKSVTKMKEIRESGTSILFVSHSLPTVRNFCDTAIWLEKGEVRGSGERLSVCQAYQDSVESDRPLATNKSSQPQESTSGKTVEKTIAIEDVRIDKEEYSENEDIRIEIQLHHSQKSSSYGVGLIVRTSDGTIATIVSTLRDGITAKERQKHWVLNLRRNHLGPGLYFVTVSVSDEDAMFSFDKLENCLKFRIIGNRNAKGLLMNEGIVRCEHDWS